MLTKFKLSGGLAEFAPRRYRRWGRAMGPGVVSHSMALHSLPELLDMATLSSNDAY